MKSAGLSLGLDIGGTKTRGVLVAGQHGVVHEAVEATRHGEVGLRATVLGVTRRLAELAGQPPAEFISVGVGLPGIVDTEAGLVTRSLNLGIEHSDVSRLLAQSFTVPVRVENDVKAAALGARFLLGEQFAELCYLNVGTGLSAGFISQGRLIRGVSNGAGELGHISVDQFGEPCVCGQRGCLEAVAGGAAIARRLEAIHADLAHLPDNPDPAAQRELHRIVNTLAVAICLVFSAYEPAVIVLGGGVVANAPWLRPALADELTRRATSSPFLARFSSTERLMEIPNDVPVAALGAAVVGRRMTRDEGSGSRGPVGPEC